MSLPARVRYVTVDQRSVGERIQSDREARSDAMERPRMPSVGDELAAQVESVLARRCGANGPAVALLSRCVPAEVNVCTPLDRMHMRDLPACMYCRCPVNAPQHLVARNPAADDHAASGVSTPPHAFAAVVTTIDGAEVADKRRQRVSTAELRDFLRHHATPRIYRNLFALSDTVAFLANDTTQPHHQPAIDFVNAPGALPLATISGFTAARGWPHISSVGAHARIAWARANHASQRPGTNCIGADPVANDACARAFAAQVLGVYGGRRCSPSLTLAIRAGGITQSVHMCAHTLFMAMRDGVKDAEQGLIDEYVLRGVYGDDVRRQIARHRARTLRVAPGRFALVVAFLCRWEAAQRRRDDRADAMTDPPRLALDCANLMSVVDKHNDTQPLDIVANAIDDTEWYVDIWSGGRVLCVALSSLFARDALVPICAGQRIVGVFVDANALAHHVVKIDDEGCARAHVLYGPYSKAVFVVPRTLPTHSSVRYAASAHEDVAHTIGKLWTVLFARWPEGKAISDVLAKMAPRVGDGGAATETEWSWPDGVDMAARVAVGSETTLAKAVRIDTRTTPCPVWYALLMAVEQHIANDASSGATRPWAQKNAVMFTPHGIDVAIPITALPLVPVARDDEDEVVEGDVAHGFQTSDPWLSRDITKRALAADPLRHCVFDAFNSAEVYWRAHAPSSVVLSVRRLAVRGLERCPGKIVQVRSAKPDLTRLGIIVRDDAGALCRGELCEVYASEAAAMRISCRGEPRGFAREFEVKRVDIAALFEHVRGLLRSGAYKLGAVTTAGMALVHHTTTQRPIGIDHALTIDVACVDSTTCTHQRWRVVLAATETSATSHIVWAELAVRGNAYTLLRITRARPCCSSLRVGFAMIAVASRPTLVETQQLCVFGDGALRAVVVEGVARAPQNGEECVRAIACADTPAWRQTPIALCSPPPGAVPLRHITRELALETLVFSLAREFPHDHALARCLLGAPPLRALLPPSPAPSTRWWWSMQTPTPAHSTAMMIERRIALMFLLFTRHAHGVRDLHTIGDPSIKDIAVAFIISVVRNAHRRTAVIDAYVHDHTSANFLLHRAGDKAFVDRRGRQIAADVVASLLLNRFYAPHTKNTRIVAIHNTLVEELQKQFGLHVPSLYPVLLVTHMQKDASHDPYTAAILAATGL